MRRSVRALLSSPRRRRRLLLAAIVLAAAATAAALVTFERNTAQSISTKATPGKPTVAPLPPKTVKFTRPEAKQVLPVAREFVLDAVTRKNMHRAWDIAAPELKVDTSRADWDRGENTIVTPYPVDHARWGLDYSYKNRVGLEVAVFPKPKAKLGPMVFYLEVKRSRPGARWLVDEWQPSPGSEYIVHGKTDPMSMDRSVGNPAGLSAIWLLVPLGLVAAILLIPIALGLRELRRNRRARRNYETTLPSLSQYRSS